jgi:hypothetical protein
MRARIAIVSSLLIVLLTAVVVADEVPSVGREGGFSFSDGATAQVHGFVTPDHIAPISIVSAGRTAEFWHADRYPLWAGSGDRRNAVDPATGARAAADDDTRGLGAARQTDDTFEGGFRNQDLRPGRGR